MYKIPPIQGMALPPADPELDALEIRKSNLILEAELLKAQGRGDAADGRFAEAAEIEERLWTACAKLGFHEKAWMHLFSAASCWAQAGDFYHAVSLAESLLAEPNVPERLRSRIQEFANTIRTRRAAFSQEMQLARVSSEG
jgi:hypothetical protein